MGRLILFLLILILSVWLGLHILNHPGYLLMVYEPWTVEMPLWFAIVSLLIIFVLFYWVLSSIDYLSFQWFRFKNWLRFRKVQKTYTVTQQGLIALIEGQWRYAERLFFKSAPNTRDPLIHYLGAAKAAHELKDFDRRDQYIKKAYQISPKDDLAIGIVQASLELEEDKLEQASATLNRLTQASPKHPIVLKLLEKVYVRLSDWKSLLQLLPTLKKAKIINSEQFTQFEKNLYCELLNRSQTKNLNELHQFWSQLPNHVKKNPDVVEAYVKLLIKFPGSYQEIEDLVRKTLKYTWRPGLVTIYSQLTFSDLNRQLVIAGAWLKTHGQHPELFLLLGKLCAQLQLWGKAKDYFEKCLNLHPNAEASLEYGKLLEDLGEPDEAREKFQEGLVQLVNYSTVKSSPTPGTTLQPHAAP